MGSAISIGTTGLTASSIQMDVIGNNLANSNTLGFKAGSTYFSSMLNQSLPGAGSMASGQGVSVSAISTQFSQGSFESTGNATDLAIDGGGFFMLTDSGGAMYYTRAGNFHISNEGYLVDNKSYRVQGYNTFSAAASESATSDDQLTDISLSNVQSAPKSSSEVSIGANLNEDSPYGEKFKVSQNVFDSKGGQHNLSFTFLKTEGSGMWGFDANLDSVNYADLSTQAACGLIFDENGILSGMYRGALDGAAVATGGGITETVVRNPGQLYKSTKIEEDPKPITLTKGAGSGAWGVTENGGYTNVSALQETSGEVNYLKVDLDGRGGADIIFTLDNEWGEGDNITFDIAVTAVDLQDLALNFGTLANGATIGTPETSGGLTFNKINWDLLGDGAQKITGYASTSVVKSLGNDGYTAGVLKSLSFGNDGTINGFFSNAQTLKLGQLVLSDFPNVSGLKKIGNYFGETIESGASIRNKPGSSGLGQIMSNNLEISNTDVAKEFINMIMAQRAYQANARVITTADQMISELMNIKR